MQKIGVVKAIKDRMAIVEIERFEACGKCGACLGSMGSKTSVKAKNSVYAQEGDKVELEAEDVNILNVSFLIYALPLFFFLFGLAGGYFIYPYLFHNRTFQSIFAAVFGIVVMLSGGFFLSKKFVSKKCHIKIIKVVS